MSEIKVMSRKTALTMALAILLLIGMTILGFHLLNRQYTPVAPGDKSYIDVIIPENSGAGQVAAILKDYDLIHGEKAFLAYCRQNGFDNKLKAGHYQFSRSQSVQEIVEDIIQGKVVHISFTIPEGYTVEQIGDLLVKQNICTMEEWNEALEKDYDYDFLHRAEADTKNCLEGFLFPDTYFISENIKAEQIVQMMLNGFARIWEENFAEQAREKDMNVYDTVTLAAMIEKEAMAGDERRTISGVIRNRLDKGMLLQIDATVLYCLGTTKDTVTYADLEVDSQYNTYQVTGLPPGPIACPGKASLEAALNPENHSYYYYVSRGDGTHEFSRTYAEHLKAKSKYIK